MAEPTLTDRVDSLEGGYQRIEEKVDALGQKVEQADWNGKGPLIHKLAELAPLVGPLTDLASAHVQDMELDRAERLVAEHRRQRREDLLQRLGLRTVHGLTLWIFGTLSTVTGLIWGTNALLSTLHVLGWLR